MSDDALIIFLIVAFLLVCALLVALGLAHDPTPRVVIEYK